jgi:hypothetical protein
MANPATKAARPSARSQNRAEDRVATVVSDPWTVAMVVIDPSSVSLVRGWSR